MNYEDKLTVNDPDAEKSHPSRSRRERLAKVSHDFSHVPVKVGTQQAHALDVIREASQTLAKQIAEKCPPGPDQQRAMDRVMEAKMWATHAISHRGSGGEE